ncbi:MAG: hypothetical protein ACREN3_13985 [Gemmatimonadaceae bacterium]
MRISTAVLGLNWGLISVPTKRLRAKVRRAERAIAAALLGGDYRVTPEGLIVLDEFRPQGVYRHRAPRRERDFIEDHNLLVDEGILKTLGVMFGTDTKLAGWYIALHAGTATPTNTLKAANYASTMNEITSLSEGYSNTTRPAWAPAQPAANGIDNYASEATFNMVTAASITVQGAALVSDATRGGTGGVLASCAKFDNARELYNEPFDVGYKVSLTD